MTARSRLLAAVVACAAAAGGAGCQLTDHYHPYRHPHTLHPAPVAEVPTEQAKALLPDYVIEPPDVLRIDAVRAVPLPPYRIHPLDALVVNATETLPDAPVAGVYPVDPDGSVNLGFGYGRVAVADLTTDEAAKKIEAALVKVLKKTTVSVSLAQTAAVQQIRGEHLVGQDGKITLGVYGSVRVGGMTREQAKAAVEAHLSMYLQRPEVAVDVVGYNSKVYYVITDGGGLGEQVVRVPVTGNETVLDAVSQIGGLPPAASKKMKHIWVARPAAACPGGVRVMPVDWRAIAEGAMTETNYQLLPGDRVYVRAKPLVTADTALARVLAPVERLLGVTLLGSATYNSITGRISSGVGF